MVDLAVKKIFSVILEALEFLVFKFGREKFKIGKMKFDCLAILFHEV